MIYKPEPNRHNNPHVAFREDLQDDEYYYGDIRNAAVSASNINSILDGTFMEPSVWKIHFEVGKYFHCQTLEPEKVLDFDVRDVARRSPGDKYLKKSEQTMCRGMKVSHDSNVEARGILYGPGVEYEVPGFTIIDGVLFIGKCDIRNPLIRYIGDLKSTRDLFSFPSSVEKWYTSQMWIYWKIFNMPTVYVVTEKKPKHPRTTVSYPEQYLYAQGKAKVLEAITIYKRDYPEHYERNLELQRKLYPNV